MLAIAGGVVYWLLRDEPEVVPPVESPAVVESAEPTEALEPEEIEVPPLAESDAWIRAVAEQLSSHPRIAAWLANDELVRRFVAAVDNVADGISPRNHVAFAAPESAFGAAGADGRMTGRSYDRYSPLVAAVDSLHVEGTADLYRRLEPMFDEAYRDLGYPDGRFSDSLSRAIRRILSVPVISSPPKLVEAPGGWEFEDTKLESLDHASKHLLRLGPDNLTLLQRKVRRLATAIGLEI
jgi:hypothetical protein